MKRLIKLSFLTAALLFCLAFTVTAEERAASNEEIAAVKSGQSTAYSWENSGNHWKRLYLDVKGKSWKYAKDRWVQIGSRFYYFDGEGNAEEGWFRLEGKWYFAEYDSTMRNSETACVVRTGWASISNDRGRYHTFYFATDKDGRPSGMLQGGAGRYDAFTIDGREVYFDDQGYADTRTAPGDVQKFSGKRV